LKLALVTKDQQGKERVDRAINCIKLGWYKIRCHELIHVKYYGETGRIRCGKIWYNRVRLQKNRVHLITRNQKTNQNRGEILCNGVLMEERLGLTVKEMNGAKISLF
jgi:hypothetical protein